MDLDRELENLKSGLLVFLERQHPDQLAARRIVHDLALFSHEAITKGKLDPWLVIASHWLVISGLMDEFPTNAEVPQTKEDPIDEDLLPKSSALGKILLQIEEDEPND